MSYFLPRTMTRLVSALAAAFVLTMAVAQMPTLHAAPAAAATNKAPLKHTFRKDKKAEAGPYVLTLKNTSEQPLKISGQVLLAVAFHATDKARAIAEETIAPGKSLKISDLASADKVTIKVEGYDTLELVVPTKKEKKETKTE